MFKQKPLSEIFNDPVDNTMAYYVEKLANTPRERVHKKITKAPILVLELEEKPGTSSKLHPNANQKCTTHLLKYLV